ncbi:MAG TPA: Cro/CI family transcriptional regulator [Rhodanobacteraceae bacterium]|nr:Cro/CI family transcriptional regulator [Rhodanobacteraceae bacterium]
MHLLTTYRQERGLSQKALAELLDVHQSLVSQWEQGIVRITPERATQIERVTHGAVSREALVFGPWDTTEAA